MTDYQKTLEKAFSPQEYKKLADRLTGMIADYFRNALNCEGVVLPHLTPDADLQAAFPAIDDIPVSGEEAFELVRRALEHSNHYHHPRCAGHQVTSALPFAALMDHLTSFLNNSAAVFEVAPLEPVLERILIKWIAGLAGYDEQAGGVLTSGGSMGNLTALLAARQRKVPGNVWDAGLTSSDFRPAVLVSEQAHYSIRRAAQIMGLGGDAVIPVGTEDFRVTPEHLQRAHNRARVSGFTPIAVCASACTTATGTFDPLDLIADFCEERQLWFHVDGAHGFAAALSGNYRHLLAGIERTDSFIWDLHKMMLMPSLITAVVFRNNRDSYVAFTQKASYLFEERDQEPWFDLAQRTVECTKPTLAFKAYFSLAAYGTAFFGDYVESRAALTRRFAEIIEDSDDFELATMPDFNIICFRYAPAGVEEERIDELQAAIRKRIIESGFAYIVQTNLNGKWYLRCTVINPLTTDEHLARILDAVREAGENLLKRKCQA